MANQNWLPSKTSLGGRFRTTDRVVATKQADTTILLDLRGGRYYRLNPVGGLIWSVLTTGASMDCVLTRVREEFDASDKQLTNDVEEFIGTLLSAEMVRRAD